MTVPSPVSVSVWVASNFLPAKAMAVSPLIFTTGSSCIHGRGRGYLYNRVQQLLQKQRKHLFKKSRLPPFSSPPRNITTSTLGSSLAFTPRRTFSSFYSSNNKMSSEEITHPTIKGMFFLLFMFFFQLPRVILPLSHDDHHAHVWSLNSRRFLREDEAYDLMIGSHKSLSSKFELIVTQWR
jgi:hypothetical protein